MNRRNFIKQGVLASASIGLGANTLFGAPS